MQWTACERAVASELRSELAAFERLTRSAHRLVAAGIDTCVSGRSAPPSHAAEVQARLLVHMSRDLRVVQLAAVRGYSLQALSLAAGIFEHSCAVAFIGTSADRAREWEQHQDVTQSYPPGSRRRDAIRAMILAGAPDIPVTEHAIEDQLALYHTFCMAKHGNPKSLRRYGLAVKEKTVRLHHTPFLTTYVVRQGAFALYHSTRMVVLATVIFAAPLLRDSRTERRRSYNRLLGRVVHLLEATPLPV